MGYLPGRMGKRSESFHPELFGKFFLLQRLGAGGMAEIFRAKTEGTGGFEKELVVKRILPALSSDQQFIRMLVNEAKLTVALTHPTIAQIYELGEVEGRYFISMELVEGATLHEVMHLARNMGRPLALEQSIFLCQEVLRGLGYAHERTDGAGTPLGVVHCDVSPDNVMVTWDGGVKLLDFGVARAAQTSLSNHREGTLMGKLSYASPEQAEGKGFDHRVDLFAVGVMFYELLTGKHPFGKVSNVDDLIASRRKPVVPPSQVATLPKDFDAFVAKSLAYDPEERFQTAEEMAEELNEMLFPTSSLAVMGHIAATMREIYKDSIERQRKLRAEDAQQMRALASGRRETTGEQDAGGGTKPAIPTAAGTKIFVSGMVDTPPRTSQPPRQQTLPPPPRRAPAPRQTRKAKGRTGAFLAGLVLGAAGALGAGYVYLESEPPILMVRSEPSGAEVFLGDRALGTTPLLLEAFPLSPTDATLTLRREAHRELVVPIKRRGRLAKATGQLESSLQTLRIESVPSGASVTFQGRRIGQTPLDVRDLAEDVRQRFDLHLPGYQVDSFVVRPQDVEEGQVRRVLRRE